MLGVDFLLNTLRLLVHVNCVFGIRRDVFLAEVYFDDEGQQQIKPSWFMTVIFVGCYQIVVQLYVSSPDSSSMHVFDIRS